MATSCMINPFVTHILSQTGAMSYMPSDLNPLELLLDVLERIIRSIKVHLKKAEIMCFNHMNIA